MYILSRRGRALLAQFAQSDVLVGFDFDGTLAPIVERPEEAGLPVSTRDLLREVALRYPCAVVSGRSLADTRRLIAGTGIRYIAGNHGAETGAKRKIPPQVAAWKRTLDRALARIPGLHVEDKGYSITIHYRQSTVKPLAQKESLRAARQLPGARILAGKQSVNIVPENTPDKGTAMECLRGKLGCERILFAGDDVTDDDVFSLPLDGRLLGIQVGPRARSRAAHSLRSQQEIDRLLGALVEHRPASGS